ncbi:MAG: ATP-binding protein [Desulfobacteraceae bacterium]|nr:ATP-binding protein [Desulfobacteraceae bacterium]
MTLSYLPIFCVDVFGSLTLIILGFLCVRLALKIRAHDRENAIWIYLVWVCSGLMVFAMSRSTGHIVKQLLILGGYDAVWRYLQPFSGSVTTFALILVASITLFFRQIWEIYKQILRDKKALQEAHEELMSLNQNLEKRVEQRTLALAVESEQRMSLEKHMAQTEKLAAIGELSAGVAHEINNPLGIILGYSQLLIRAETEDSNRREDLKTIEKHVKHCQRIVADLLSFSRSAGTEKQPGNVHEILDDVLDFIGKHTDSKRIEVVRDYDPQLPLVFMNREKIKQVFINLVMNARYAMESEGVLTLKTRYPAGDSNAVIRITDNGTGIADGDITRIFEPFFTTKPTGQGTGLGLSVTYGIIKDHGGDIYAESKVGQGTTFTILLPAP